MRALVTGCVRSSSGTRSGASWVRRPMVSKKSAIEVVSKPEEASMPMPTRSASYSFSRVKLICDWAAMLWAA